MLLVFSAIVPGVNSFPCFRQALKLGVNNMAAFEGSGFLNEKWPLDNFTIRCQPAMVSESENQSPVFPDGHKMQARINLYKESNRKLQAAAEGLLRDQEAERCQIARELEYEIGQNLVAVRMNLDYALQSPSPCPDRLMERLRECLQVVEHVTKQVRDLSQNLLPWMFHELGLERALTGFVNRQAVLAGLKAELHCEPMEVRLDSAIETGCYRVAQEAMTNVIRHAKASGVSVALTIQSAQLHLSVRDDGVGFDVAAARQKVTDEHRSGLLRMESLAIALGGGLEIKSAPDQGTELHAWFPLERRPTLSAEDLPGSAPNEHADADPKTGG